MSGISETIQWRRGMLSGNASHARNYLMALRAAQACVDALISDEDDDDHRRAITEASGPVRDAIAILEQSQPEDGANNPVRERT